MLGSLWQMMKKEGIEPKLLSKDFEQKSRGRPLVNSPLMRGYEGKIHAAVEGGQTVQYSATPLYKGRIQYPVA